MDITPYWCHGMCECLACGYKWMGVWPVGADDLICKSCGSTDTVREEK